ncbi:MAG TPA: response regulator, partial [Allocoleopsis sp.]
MQPFKPEEFTILVVDDMPPNLHLLCSILEYEGYATIFTNRGKQALELVKQANPDLILLDLMMPEMNGLEVCENLKSDPNTRDIPVIFLTASNEKTHVLKAFQIGAVDYITKPFMNEELLARVHTHLNLKKSNNQLKQTLSELIEARDVALESVQIKTRFMANMSHEIRTPMNALLGLTEVLQTTNLNLQQSECVNMIKSSGNQLLSLVNDLLDFSKLEAGAMKIESLPFELNSVI